MKIKNYSVQLCLVYLVFWGTQSIYAQKEFFRTNISFSPSELTDFYSSFSVDSTQVYFLSNKWELSVYNKRTGDLKWSYDLRLKSNTAPILYENTVLIEKKIADYTNRIIQLDVITGDTIQTLHLEQIYHQPYLTDSILYCSAILPEVGGAIIAYDLKKNTIRWQKLLSHGVMLQPYFFSEKIIANFDASVWFDLDYSGNALVKNPTCYSQNDDYYPYDETYCPTKSDLSHSYLKNLMLKEIQNDELSYVFGEKEFAVMSYESLKISSTKNKVLDEVNLYELSVERENEDIYSNEYQELLKIETNSIWFFFNNTLIEYDYVKKVRLKAIDLNAWNPHKVLLEGTKLWLISKTDGELVGLELNE